MSWNKNLPDGSKSIALGDDDIRENNDSLEDAVDLEHDFTTGGTQTGRHAFPVDSLGNLASLNPAGVRGGLAIATGVRPSGVLAYHNGTSWILADNGNDDVARTDEVNLFTAPSWSEWLSVAPVSAQIDIDLDLGPTFYSTINTNVLINNPSNAVANHCQNFLLQITWNGALHTLTWGAAYRAANGIAPAYSTENGAVNLFTCTVLSTGSVLVSSISGIGSF